MCVYFSLLFTVCLALSILRSLSCMCYLSLSQIFSNLENSSNIYTTQYDHINFLKLPLYSPQYILHSTSSLFCYEYFIFNPSLSLARAVLMCLGQGYPLRHGILVVATSLKLNDSLFPNNN